MATHALEQLLHGYRRGHEQLAASVKLPARDAELVTRLSDLSGSLSGAPAFNSYLTVYPLPSGTYFALGRTWPDPNAARAGCVLTHTLLVPMAAWTTLAEPRVLDGLLTFRPSRSPNDYTSAVAMPPKVAPVGSNIDYSGQDALLTFVHRYFGEGKRPVIWFGQDQSEEILWRLLRGLWPKIRATVSACTFCLQPRTLEDRPFDLMFAPSEVYPRFLKMNLEQEHFIDAAAALPTDQGNLKIEPWCRAWASKLFGPMALGLPPGESDLWVELDEDPTAIRRLLLIEGIAEGNSTAPQVFVGAMDLVESLAKSRNSALASKRRAAERAVRAAREVGDPANGLDSLRLVEDRLRRSSFSRVQDSVGPVLLDAVAAITRKSPEVTAQWSVLSPAGPDDLSESWFGRGLLKGLRELAHDEPGKLLLFRDVPAIVSYVPTAEVEVSAEFIRTAAAHRGDQDTRASLFRWLARIRDHERRSALRASLVPMLGSGDSDILGELLKDLHAEEVGVILDALWLQTDHFEAPSIRDLVTGQVARSHPGETRAWTRRLSQWTPIVAHIVAATYPQTRQGLLGLLDGHEVSPGAQKAKVLAAFMRGLGSDRYPNWLADVAREQTSLLSTLLEAAGSSSSTVSEQMQKLLGEVPDLAVAHSPALLQQVLDSSQRPFFEALLNVTMRSLISGCIEGVVSETIGRPFQEDQYVVPWFQAVRSSDLRSLVTDRTWSSTPRWFNAWRWTVNAPSALYARGPTLLPELVEALFRSHHTEWSPKISDMWLQILRRARSEPRGERTRLVLCVQALKFSFENTPLPLGPLVAEAFHDVYTAVTESPTLPTEAAPLFGIFDWDKGRELRRELVDSFLHSQWPPGDLVLAVDDVRLLRKIFKRLVRKHGGLRYAETALTDLEQRTDRNAAPLARALREMLANPNFYEDWD